MAYRYGNRHQTQMFPPSIEEYIAEDDPVRAYDAFVESLDLAESGIALHPRQVGCPQYDPRAMLKLLVYGYSYGVRSSRKLEREVCHNLSFIWLMGGLKPDHKTIAEFRRRHKKALANVLKQCARLCLKLDLIEGNTLFVDGSKMRGNASISSAWSLKRCERHLKQVDIHIESILTQCDRIDDRENGAPSLVQLRGELKGSVALKAKIERIQQELKESGAHSINTTDPDCTRVKGRQGTHAGYNSQIVVDEKQGLIVSADVVNESNDVNQFARQINQANATLGKPCQNACADAGYANTRELKKIDDQHIAVIVPTIKQAHGKEPPPFDKSRFRYDADNDRYQCPRGELLTYRYFDRSKRHRVYQIESASSCRACEHFGLCTQSKNGRRVKRLADEETKLKLEERYQTGESQAIYQLRKQKVELPFGHMKRNLGVGAFLLRGLDGVKAEMALLSSSFNLARMITLLGVPKLVATLAG